MFIILNIFCDVSLISAADVTEQITRILTTISIPQEQINQFKEHLKQSKKSEIEYRNQELGVLHSSLTKAAGRLDKLINMYIDGDIEKEIYESKKAELELSKAQLEEKIKAHSTADNSFNDLISELIEIIKNFANIFNFSTNIELKRNLLKLVFRTLEIKEGNLGYALSFPFSEMQNLSTSPNWLPHMDDVRFTLVAQAQLSASQIPAIPASRLLLAVEPLSRGSNPRGCYT